MDKNNLSASINQLFVGNFSEDFNNMIDKCVKTSFTTYHIFKSETRNYFDGYNKGNAIFSRFLNFMIEKELSKSAFTPISKHRAKTVRLNEYGYNGLFLCTEDFVITISKTSKPMELPPKSNFRQRLATMNGDLPIQLKLPCDGFEVDTPFKYAIITYGRDSNFELSHLNIITPNPDYRGIVEDCSIDIMKHSNLIVMPEAVTEEQLTTLKSEFMTKVKVKE